MLTFDPRISHTAVRHVTFISLLPGILGACDFGELYVQQLAYFNVLFLLFVGVKLTMETCKT